MQRRAEQLYTGRGQELRDADPADRLFHLLRYRQQRRDERREVERREDGQGVPHREERVARRGDRPGRGPRDAAAGRGPEHAGELAVLVEAERHVDAGRGEEFRRARRDGLGGVVRDGAAGGVDAVGGGVGAEVEGRDQEGGFGGQVAVGPGEEGEEGGAHGGAEGGAVGSILDDRAEVVGGVCQ